MKNQYFGDNRDLFKYDLVFQIIKAGLVNHFTFIPMLTPYELSKTNGKREGEQRNRSKAKAGWKNHDLIKFLNEFDDENKRDITQLEGFFKKKGMEAVIFGDYFCHVERGQYFQEVKKRLLPKSLICVDPDIGMGLEVKRPREKHILCFEVKDLFKCMDNSSLLMIFQFFPHERRETYLRRISKRLKEEVRNLPIYISDNQVVFFFLAKDNFLRKSLGEEISNYGETYHLRVEIT